MTRNVRAILIALLLAGTGCSRFTLKKKADIKPFVPPPPVVRTIPDEPLVVGEPPANPGLYLDISSIPYPIDAPTIELPERPKPAVQRPKPAAPPAPTAEPNEPTPQPVPVPKLTQILTEEESKTYRTDIDEATKSAESVLDKVARRPLNSSQSELVKQVRALLVQADGQRNTDLLTARNLARRAAILARDLQSTLR